MSKKSFNFFKVITQSRTYLNMFYLLLSFPLGIFYFVFLITGLSLGFGLVITLLGIPILLGMPLLWRLFADFERQLSKIMLNINITYVPIKKPKGLWKNIQAYLSDTYTWKSLIYLFIKFPLGIISFVVWITLLSLSLGLMATPVLYHLTKIGLLNKAFCDGLDIICPIMYSYSGSIIIGIIGLFLLFVSLHAFNGLAHVSGSLAKIMLEKKK